MFLFFTFFLIAQNLAMSEYNTQGDEKNVFFK